MAASRARKAGQADTLPITERDIPIGIVGLDPSANGQLTPEEIARCQADPTARLKMAKVNIPLPTPRTKGPRYTPVSKRQDKPNAVMSIARWISVSSAGLLISRIASSSGVASRNLTSGY